MGQPRIKSFNVYIKITLLITGTNNYQSKMSNFDIELMMYVY